MRELSKLSLYYTPGEFHIDGIPYEAIPIFVCPNSMRIEFLPTEWLIYLAVIQGRTQSPLSWRLYAYTLRDYIAFADAHSLDWRAPTEATLGHYSNHLRKRGLKRNTLVRAVGIVCAFYEWTHARGYITTLPLTYQSVRPSRHGKFLAHVVDPDKLSARSIIVPKAHRHERIPRFFTRQEQEQFIKLLSPRDQLIALWALYTGAREHEICALTVEQIPDGRLYRGSTVVRVPLHKTKGDVPGDLYVPTWLIDKTFQHIRYYDRRSVVHAARRRGTTVPDNIFLSRWGRGLKPDSVYQLFKAALNEAGVPGTFHDLRHTYAISMLDRLMRTSQFANSDGRNPLLILKNLMRHSSIETTQKYLQAREFHLTDIFSDAWELPDGL